MIKDKDYAWAILLSQVTWPSEENVCPVLPKTSTLPLSEGDILHHTKLVPEVFKLHLRQRFGENVCNLLICGYVLELHCSLLYHVSDEVVFDLNMLQPVMKY
jgi:hypothetical protein